MKVASLDQRMASADNNRPDDYGAASPLHLLHRAGQCADELFATHIGKDSEMTPRQFIVLQAIPGTDEPSQTDLVRLTGIDRSTLADIVRRMVLKGLVTRRRTRQDARMYAVRLTEKGEQSLLAAGPAASATDEKILAALTASERATFLATLTRIVTALEASGASA